MNINNAMIASTTRMMIRSLTRGHLLVAVERLLPDPELA
jgi:hypothetical protein